MIDFLDSVSLQDLVDQQRMTRVNEPAGFQAPVTLYPAAAIVPVAS
jgi:hypothetical protein